MDNSQETADLDYMDMLNRTIPGVGTTPATKANTLPAVVASSVTATAHSDLTARQRSAIHALEAALEEALFVSEGEEPMETVHIVPKTSTLHSLSSSSASSPSIALHLPSNKEFISLLRDARLLPTDQDKGEQTDGDQDLFECELTFDLRSILAKSNPGADKIQKALEDIFQYKTPSSTDHNPTVALYRVTPASDPTRVHLWVLGWVDLHLLGFHTISIES